MKKSTVTSHSLGTFPSPGAPRGWSSERVPHPTSTSSSRRHISAAAALAPFYSGRALPSKWEDAERWICSPVSGYGAVTQNLSQAQFQRRPKSKSGPIVPPGMGHYSSCSPGIQVLDGALVKNFMVGSPFSTGVLVPNGVCVNYGGGQDYLVQSETNVARSSSIPGAGWPDLVSEDSLPSSQDDKLDEIMDAENMVSHVPSRRDMATQMSLDGSTDSSPRGKSSFCHSPRPILPVDESRSDHCGKLEIREVQVDNQATVLSWSKRHRSRISKKGVPDIEELYQNATATCTSSWDLSEVATSNSKLQREEAKIIAWENLQKAKAEAAIRKLEMKLEKKRSDSIDKILNKLRTAQTRAQEMRSSISVSQDQPNPKTSYKIRFFHSQKSSLRSCFTCHSS